MEAIVRPEPPEHDRQALLEALEPEPTPYESAWREAALRDGADVDDP